MFKNLQIGVRLGLGFGLVLSMLVLISLLAYSRLTALNMEIASIVSNRYSKTVIAHEIVDQLNIIARALRNSLLVRQEQGMRKEPERVTDAREKIPAGFDKLEKTMVTPAGKAVMVKVESDRRAYEGDQRAFPEMLTAGKRNEAVDFMLTRLRKSQANHFSSVNELIAYLSERTVETGRSAEALSSSAERMIAILGAAAVLMGVLFAWIMVRSISRPVNSVAAATNKMATGDFDFKVDIDSKDEIGFLAKAIQALQANVQLLIDEMNRMSREHDAGDIDVKIDESKFQNDFRTMAKGVNNMVFGHIAVKKKDGLHQGIRRGQHGCAP